MQNELLEQLESKIGQLLDEVELLRMEVSELREEKASLEQQQTQSVSRLQGLLARFEQSEG
ncbi:cell division protein ZapB [Marinobacterium arenosum]|uniref:cell division protein ZapB n=1 Tax=Marinobacterium arenosum TaxID=2862496 RepID=UPI001C945F02|nr:cell division protein ZapB [Marinobacterium arenosum]MBY4675637.1 cell division protein ZapB [Marinobacterium arenosum]